MRFEEFSKSCKRGDLFTFRRTDNFSDSMECKPLTVVGVACANEATYIEFEYPPDSGWKNGAFYGEQCGNIDFERVVHIPETDIKVGAEVTITGKVLEIFYVTKPGNDQYKIELSTGKKTWFAGNVFSSVKNPQHPEPASGYALVDGKVAWCVGGEMWNTEDDYYTSWTDLVNHLEPKSVIELVAKDGDK